MLYFLWGNVLCAGSLSFSAICRQARPAVLVAVIWVIMSGFGANLVLTQFIEQGPSVAATILQIIPSMGLFRGDFAITNLRDKACPARTKLIMSWKAFSSTLSAILLLLLLFSFFYFSVFIKILYFPPYLLTKICPLVALVGIQTSLHAMFTPHNQLSQPGHDQWWVSKSDLRGKCLVTD